jgi:hypothetical protein
MKPGGKTTIQRRNGPSSIDFQRDWASKHDAVFILLGTLSTMFDLDNFYWYREGKLGLVGRIREGLRGKSFRP